MIRHLTSILHYMGFLELDGDKLERTSLYKLQIWVKRTRDWMDGEFKTGAEMIRSVHREAGEELLGLKAKDARDKLKKAEQVLDALSLDFIGKPWAELNRDTDDGAPAYEQLFSSATGIIRDVRLMVQRVYDPAGLNAFRYSHDSLRELEANEKSQAYPLWKRLSVLRGFYEALDRKRRELTKKVELVHAEVDRRVPELASGEKAFPIQPLTLPLDLYRQELNFGADKPEKTVAAGGTSFGVKTVGFKIAGSHYLEALERIEAIESGLNQPGKLVAKFFELLGVWEGLRSKLNKLKDQVGSTLGFFVDAPYEVRKNYDLDGVEGELQDLTESMELGGIREGTDNREAAGTPVLQLVNGLKDDLAKLKDGPRQLEDRLQDIMSGVMPSLEELYGKKHAYHFNAVQRIRMAQGKPYLMWPDRMAETYGRTVTAFEAVVREIETEGERFFAGCGDTTFSVFVGFCQLEAEKKPIDWNSAEHKRHVDVLMSKNLLRLQLVG